MLSLSSLVPLGTLRPAAALSAAGEGRFADACRLVCWAAAYIVVAAVVTRPVEDADVWWHLRTGQWVVEHQSVPQTDPFSQYGQGKTWLAYSWLFEVLLHGLYAAFGLFGIILYRVVLSFAVVAAVHRLIIKRCPRFLPAAVLFGAAVVILIPLLAERPWLFTILFTTLTLDAVLDLRDGRATWTFWLLPAAFALWANLHIQFVYGLLVLGLACAAPLIDRLLGARPAVGAAVFGSCDWWKLVGLTAACTAATLINPYHARLYAVVFEYGTQPAAYELVQELCAPAFRDLWSWVVLGMAAAAAFALGRRGSLSAFDVLLLAATVYLTFHARRDQWFLLLASLAVLTRAFPAADPEERFGWTGRRVLALAGIVLIVMALTGVARRMTPARLEQVIAEQFPEESAAVVERGGHAGPLYNHFDWGGYLIWRLPGLPVAMDGRTNLHGDDRMRRSFATWAGRKGWDDDPELAAAGVVVAGAGCPLASLLRTDPRFEIAHEDDLAVVFIRRAPARPSPTSRR